MRISIIFFVQSHVSSLAGTIYKKLEDLVSNGNTEFKVLSAWDTFSNWACIRLENKYCMKKAQDYFNKWQAGEKSVTISYYILAPRSSKYLT